MRIIGAALALAAVLALASTAEAKSCRGKLAGPPAGLGIVRVTAVAVGCPTAKNVAKRFDNSSGGGAKSKVTVHDSRGRRWRCRITERATGTDPGYNPFTSVRCARSRSVVRFKYAS
jgi:hypothetical protein